jgi:hypothetical protein
MMRSHDCLLTVTLVLLAGHIWRVLTEEFSLVRPRAANSPIEYCVVAGRDDLDAECVSEIVSSRFQLGMYLSDGLFLRICFERRD